MVECANKLVMQTRLKGPGMRWAPTHVNPMLALRTAVCNERWTEAWAEVVRHRRHQRTLRFQQRATQHLQQIVSSLLLLLLLPPCLGPLALQPIIPGNEPLPAATSWPQKNDGHPLP